MFWSAVQNCCQPRKLLTFEAVGPLVARLCQSFCQPLQPLVFGIFARAHNSKRFASVKPDWRGFDVKLAQLHMVGFSGWGRGMDGGNRAGAWRQKARPVATRGFMKQECDENSKAEEG